MVSLSLSKINKSYGIDTILKDVSFSVENGEKIAIVGPNGAGKSTLLNIIAGIEPYDSGDIYIAKDFNVGYMKQNVNITGEDTILSKTLSVFEDLINLEKEIRKLEIEIGHISSTPEKKDLDKYLKIYEAKTAEFVKRDGYSYNSKAQGVLIGLGFKPEEMSKRVNMLSGGEKSRLLLAQLLLKDSKILMLDEPTNHLDIDSVSWLETYLKNYNNTVIIVSHDRYFLEKVTDRVFEVRNHNLRVFNCKYSKFTEESQKLLEEEKKKYQLNQEEIARQKEIIAKLKSFGREKQVKRANSRQKVLDKMEVVDKPFDLDYKSNIKFHCKVKSGKDVLQVKELNKAFPGKILFENVNMDIYRGEKVALIGPNGAGKTTLFNMLMEKKDDEYGQVKFGSNVNVAFFNQERTDLDDKNTVLEEVWSSYPDMKEVEVRNALAGFRFFSDDVYKLVGSLSGGEKSRISLLKLMLSDANFLFMDEPTNHLDIDSKEALEDAIIGYDGTVLVISHDRYFLNKVPEKIYSLENQRVKMYNGNYDYMLEKIQEKEILGNLRRQENQVLPNKTKEVAEKKKQRQLINKRKSINQKCQEAEEFIHKIEKDIDSINKELCLEENYSNPEKSRNLTLSLEKCNEELTKAYENWEELLQQLEEIKEIIG